MHFVVLEVGRQTSNGLEWTGTNRTRLTLIGTGLMVSGISKLPVDWPGLRVYFDWEVLDKAFDENVEQPSLFHKIFCNCADLFSGYGVLFSEYSLAIDNRKIEEELLSARFRIRPVNPRSRKDSKIKYYFVPGSIFFQKYSRYLSDDWNCIVLLEQLEDRMVRKLDEEEFGDLDLIKATGTQSFFLNYDGAYWAYFGEKHRDVVACIEKRDRSVSTIVGTTFCDTMKLHDWDKDYGLCK